MTEKPEETNKPWMIRDVPEYVRRKVKIYATTHGVTIADALELLVNQAIPGGPEEVMQDPRGNQPTTPSQ